MNPACWVLMSPCGGFYWSAHGFRPVPEQLSPRGWLAWPRWSSKEAAGQAAKEILRTKGAMAVPCPVRAN